jgi:hypothetical protein
MHRFCLCPQPLLTPLIRVFLKLKKRKSPTGLLSDLGLHFPLFLNKYRMNFIKKSKKQIGIYLLVYLVILVICGVFQFFVNCQAQYSICLFETDNLNTIVTTTSYVLTPLIAIIGFQSWREAENYKNAHKTVEAMLDSTRNIQKKWHLSREYGDHSLFQDYYIKDVTMIDIDQSAIESFFPKVFKKSYEIFEEFNELKHLAVKLSIYQKDNLRKLNHAIIVAEKELYTTSEEIWNFHNTLVSKAFNSPLSTLSDVEMNHLCQKFDRYCNQVMGHKGNDERINYSERIDDYIFNISTEIENIGKDL